MTTWQKYYIGDHGPYYYDSDRAIEDPDGDFAGESEQVFLSDGPATVDSLKITTGGTDTNDVVTHGQLSELSSLYIDIYEEGTLVAADITAIDFTSTGGAEISVTDVGSNEVVVNVNTIDWSVSQVTPIHSDNITDLDFGTF